MHVAVVDIGSNSTRLLIAEIGGERVQAELERRTEVTRLGAGVDAGGALNEEAMQRVYSTLDHYRESIEQHHADTALAVLTSAVRDASNGEQFAQQVKERYGLEPHVLSGDREAELTFLGATSDRDPHDPTSTLVVDIGGGSTEVVIGSGHKPSFHVSNQAGVVRQTERHIHHDPPRREELTATAEAVRSIVADGVPAEHRHAVQHGIAVAGTATSLAAIAQRLEPYDPEKVQGFLLGEGECERLLEELAAVPLAERREVPGLHPDRAPTIVAGAIILLEVMRLCELPQVEVSEHDILRGAALGLGA